jgi:hypothetical protein
MATTLKISINRLNMDTPPTPGTYGWDSGIFKPAQECSFAAEAPKNAGNRLQGGA